MKSQQYAALILRQGLAFTFLWFGLTQLFDQSMWVSFIPDALVKATNISPEIFVILNGVFEVFMATLLAFGIRTRVVASLLFVHMFAIIGDLGLTAIAVRDIGLMFALLASAFFGLDDFSVTETKSL
jgi:uncharacterized membrane protein YphA (DoxX/SURF4 family)